MGEQEDPPVSVHDVLGFLPDFDSLSDPTCCPIRFPADNCRLLPVNDVIFQEGRKMFLCFGQGSPKRGSRVCNCFPTFGSMEQCFAY